MDKRTKRIIIATLLSLLFHVAIFFLIDMLELYNLSGADLKKPKPQEVTILFPENKPENDRQKFIVENENETDEVPEDANLLSEDNSRAKNPNATNPIKANSPTSNGNTEFSELSRKAGQKLPSKKFTKKPFNSEALTGKQVDKLQKGEGKDEQQEEQTDNDKQNPQVGNQGTNSRMDQKDFSVEEVGSLTLSTYAWEWAPYIRKFKEKHSALWTTPPAYNRLGLISGATKLVFTIARDGTLLKLELIDHKGHQSLEVSSMESIRAVFPFLPLPDSFPEQTLTISAILVYPDLRKLYNERRR